jgi:chaperonin GroEL (HSP60 family)
MFAVSEVDSRLDPLSHERVPVPDIYVEGKPALVLDRRTKKRTKEDAVRENLSAVEFMHDLARTIYGPRRMIKLVSTHDGNYPLSFITSDLQSVLKRIKIKHPAAQILAGAAIATYREKGDGSVSTLLLAANMLMGCGRLLRHKIHANILIDGLTLAYHQVMKQAPKLVVRGNGSPLEVTELAIRNSLEGKLFNDDLEIVTNMLSAAVKAVGLSALRGPDAEAIVDVKKVQGGSLADSQVVEGIALTQEIPHDRMPHKVKEARIALIQTELRIPDKKITRYQDYKFAFSTPDELRGFDKSKKSFLESLALKIIAAGANVVLVQGGVDDFLFDYFASRDILVIRRFPPVEFLRVNRVLGGRLIPNPLIITSRDLGWADLIEERKVGKDKLVFITGCKGPQSVDIILRGSVMWSLDDIERVMKGAVKSAVTAARDARMVWGGGAFEQELARGLHEYSRRIPDRKQLVVGAVAEAFESLPAMLGETVGLKAVDTTTQLRHRHAKGEVSAGVDVKTGEITRMSSLGVRDFLDIKLQVIKSAFETAITILRIDELFVAPDLPHAERAYIERIKGTSRAKLKAKDALLE